VDVSGAIVDNSQLATQLYVDTHGGGGGGGGDMNYVGTTPATNYLYKAVSSDGKSATKSNIVDTGSAVVVATRLRALEFDGQVVGGNLDIGRDQTTVSILADCIADKFVKSGGSDTEFLKANGTVDTTTYATLASVAPLTAATQNQSAIAGTTTFSGIVSVPTLSKVGTINSAPGGDMNIGNIGNNISIYAGAGVSINKVITPNIDTSGALTIGGTSATSVAIARAGTAVKISNVYNLPTAAPAVGQVMGCSALGDASWVSGPSALSITGYPFNPIQNGTTAITAGNKYYWFTCSLNMATIISGYSIYVAAGGADNVRVGLYRGYLKSGAVGVGANITLVGQSIASLLTTGLPFNKIAFTVVAGQSLSFAAGEYMTIAFHSAGTSNSYVGSPVASALSVDISFNTTASYVVGGFPTTLANTAINGANLNRPCFELY
jgi:hypothetical protein